MLGAVTERLTLGLVPFEVVLLEMFPSISTPTMVNVYVLAGVTPLGVVVDVLLLPHAGISTSAPLTMKSASNPQAFLVRFPPTAAPRPARANMGSGIHKALKVRGVAAAPVVTGPAVLMVIVDVAGAPSTGTGCGLKEQTGGNVTSGLIEAHDNVIPSPGLIYPLIGFTLITP